MHNNNVCTWLESLFEVLKMIVEDVPILIKNRSKLFTQKLIFILRIRSK